MRRRSKKKPHVTHQPYVPRKGLPWGAKLILIGATVGFVCLGVAPFAIAGYFIWRFFQ